MSDTQCTENPHCEVHGFDRSLSIAEDRYVCDCEGWTPAREMFDAIFEATALLKRAADGFTWDDFSYESENRSLKDRIAELECALGQAELDHKELTAENARLRDGIRLASRTFRDNPYYIAEVMNNLAALLGGGE